MTEDLQLDLCAVLTALPDALERISAWCVGRRVDRLTAFKLMIITEELFTNTVKYGYRGAVDQPILLRVSAGDPMVMIYRDAAPGFDPITAPPLPDMSAEDRPVGQTGLALVMALARTIKYERRDGHNQVTLTLADCQGITNPRANRLTP